MEERDGQMPLLFRKQNVPLDDLACRPAGRADEGPGRESGNMAGSEASQASGPALREPRLRSVDVTSRETKRPCRPGAPCRHRVRKPKI